ARVRVSSRRRTSAGTPPRTAARPPMIATNAPTPTRSRKVPPVWLRKRTTYQTPTPSAPMPPGSARNAAGRTRAATRHAAPTKNTSNPRLGPARLTNNPLSRKRNWAGTSYALKPDHTKREGADAGPSAPASSGTSGLRPKAVGPRARMSESAVDAAGGGSHGSPPHAPTARDEREPAPPPPGPRGGRAGGGPPAGGGAGGVRRSVAAQLLEPASIVCGSPLWISTLCGFAVSATGTVTRSPPSA